MTTQPIMKLVPEPAAAEPGRQYHLWLQFEGGAAAKSPDGPFTDKGVIEARSELIELLLIGQPAGVVTLHDHVSHVSLRDEKSLPVTAYVWVSEVKS